MTRFRTWRTWAAGLVALAGCAVFAAPAVAAQGPATPGPAAPGLQPVNPGPHGYFEADLGPGAHQTFSVVVKNLGDTAATYRIYPADGTTSAVTGVEYSQDGTTPTKTGSWISIATQQVTLAPGGSQTVSFTVTVPPGATPGDHVGAIASDSPNSDRVQGGGTNGSSSNVALNVTSRVVVAVVIHVPTSSKVALAVGQPSFGIESGGRQELLIPLNDTGDILFKPHIAGTVTSCGATTPALRFDRQLDTFVPHTAITYAYHINQGPLPQGCYTVEVTTDYSGRQLGSFHGNLQLGAAATKFVPAGPIVSSRAHGHKSTSAAVLVLGTCAGLLCLGVVALLLILVWRRRKDDEDEPPADGPGGSAPALVSSR